MKTKALTIIFVIIACSDPNFLEQNAEIPAAQQGSKLEPGLMAKAQKEGKVLVIVDLNVDSQSGERDNAKLKDQLLSQLSATSYKVIRRLGDLPTIGLEVGPGALAILAASELVFKVTESRFGKAA
jgi:hypothetical protein